MKRIIFLLSLSLITTGLAFSQNTPVNLGSSANNGGGTPLRTAFDYLNQNDYNLALSGTATGTDTYAVTIAAPSPGYTTGIDAPSAYTTGARYLITFTNGNGGPATLNINSIGAKTLRKNGSALVSGDIAAGSIKLLVYDGTYLQIIGDGGTDQAALDAKANLAGGNTFTGTQVLPSATSIGSVSATELGYLDNVSSAIQTQIDAKRSSNFHNVSTIVALQSYITALSAGADVNIWFPTGSYTVTSAITISGKGKVRIFSEGAVIINGLTATGDIFDIDNCTGVTVENINVNHNLNANQVDAFDIADISGPVRFTNVDVYNFGKDDQTGVRLENATEGGTVQNYGMPGAQFLNCNFYNEVLVTVAASYNYNSNPNYGIGIYAYDQAEYLKISNCSFLGIAIGARLRSGANVLISNCQFTANLPKIGGSYFGVITLDAGGTNGGKIQISNCNFNHNWAYSIYSAYSTSNRPITVSFCNFIGNAFTAIYLNNSTQSRSIIQGCFFDRANLHTGATNDPFAAATERYIYMISSRNIIMNNTFLSGVSGAAVGSGSPADNNVVKDNNYESGVTITNLNGASNQVTGNLSL